MRSPLAWHRLWAIVLKEFLQMRRDRITFAMMVGISVMQLILFGFAINTDPKRLPTVVFDASQSVYSRSFVASLENSGYFRVLAPPPTVEAAREALAIGEIQFVVSIPPDFDRMLVQGEKPVVLVEADASDHRRRATRSLRWRRSTRARCSRICRGRWRTSPIRRRRSKSASIAITTRRA